MPKIPTIKDLIKENRDKYPTLKGKHILKKINKLAKEYQNKNYENK